ncbi:uncharacterized protein LOC116852162 [Odontomachus brunneus]|uniref:uncharacterized protein LOC116852162 n=1 Tax=Odontomachus brunneus TaxID=486640 RepID=UPI0013F1BD7B|nr:uncharacterized protein LOC116852162 [Odontomachus brunneus]XP_032688122.1 uncharacterized protein LOC116852162 [Odontomachus brunneus]
MVDSIRHEARSRGRCRSRVDSANTLKLRSTRRSTKNEGQIKGNSSRSGEFDGCGDPRRTFSCNARCFKFKQQTFGRYVFQVRDVRSCETFCLLPATVTSDNDGHRGCDGERRGSRIYPVLIFLYPDLLY